MSIEEPKRARVEARTFAPGEHLPSDWYVASRWHDDRPFVFPEIVFEQTVEATHNEGWLRLHAIDRPGPLIGFRHGCNFKMSWAYDMAMYDPTGTLIEEFVHSPGKDTVVNPTQPPGASAHVYEEQPPQRETLWTLLRRWFAERLEDWARRVHPGS